MNGTIFDQGLAPRSLKETVAFGARDAEVLTGEFYGFIVLDLQVVVVDAPDTKGKLRGLCCRRDFGSGFVCPGGVVYVQLWAVRRFASVLSFLAAGLSLAADLLRQGCLAAA